jgi:hypothetical protein
MEVDPPQQPNTSQQGPVSSPQPGTSKGKSKVARSLEYPEEKPEDWYGGFFITDNINHVPQTLHANSRGQPGAINMTSAAFVHNRIPMRMEDVFKPQKYEKASDVPSYEFLPNQQDMIMIKKDHRIRIKRYLVKNLEIFKKIQNNFCVDWSIKHQYSELSKNKSKLHSLGILNFQQNTTEGTKLILQHLKSYVPEVAGKYYSTVAAGDCLTVKMIDNTIDHLFNSIGEDDNLEGITPALGPFHLRVHIYSLF